MGNNFSEINNNLSSSSSSNKPNETNIKNNKLNESDDDIFLKILDISNQLLDEYNSNFLDQNFCENLAIVYEKRLSNMSIKLLKNINSQINSNNVDKELLMVMQFKPKENDTFFVDIFKDKLEEKFWNKNIDFDSKRFQETDKNFNVDTYIKYKPKYINFRHVNDILSLKNNNEELKNEEPKNEEPNPEETKTENNEQKGGNNNINTKNINKFLGLNQNSMLKKNNKFQRNLKNTQKILNKSKEQLGIMNINNLNEDNNLIHKNERKINNVIKAQNSNREQKVKNTNEEQQIISSNNKNNKNKIEANQNKVEANQNKVEANQNKVEANQNKLKSNKNKIEPNKNNTNTNKILKLKYSIPRNYVAPHQLCSTQECKLTKKQLCQVIIENFIVRNNIIAAILTTIPRKIGKNKYEGGICYQKFLNLDKCKVCIPENYDILFNSSSIDINAQKILKDVLLKSDYLDKKKCEENNGKFLELNEKKIITLIKKSEKYKTSEEVLYPKSKYNAFYLECQKKLKDTYFDNLNLLLSILNKIRETPIISNATLNIISEETKKIIDEMYSLCHYYYVYAIIALLNSDLKEIEEIKDNNLNESYKTVLK